MSLPIKIVSTDFDGTLFAEFENPPIPPRFVALIGELQARGVKWVINTGRDMSSLMEALGRARISVQPDFLVLVEREIYEHDGVRYVPLPEWNAACERDHAAVFARVRPEVAGLMDWVNQNFRATVYADAWSPFCLIANNNGDADLIHARLNEFCGRYPDLTVVRNDIYARFSHVNYNKGTALAELTRRLGATPDEVLAAGDHLNDLPMLKREFARYLVAPVNAIPVVKEVVKEQGGFVSTLSCGTGVAEGLEFHLKQQQTDRDKAL
jgi:HAD superfamily hydrolase (TIGR01484 family)